MSRRAASIAGAVWLCMVAFAPSAWGQAAPPESDFEVTTLAKGADKTGEPIAMAVLPDRRVLHTSRDGRVWLTTAERDDVARRHDPRLLPRRGRPAGHRDRRRLRDEPLGLRLLRAAALDARRRRARATAPARRRSTPFKGHNQLSRIKLTEAGTLDLATEQQILQVPPTAASAATPAARSTSTPQGNLYLSTGDDTNPFESDGYTPIDERATRNPAFDAQRSSANTNDLRGKLLRITVNADGTLHGPGRQPVRARHRWARGPRSTRWASATRSASRSTTRPAGSTSATTAPTRAARARPAAPAARSSST